MLSNLDINLSGIEYEIVMKHLTEELAAKSFKNGDLDWCTKHLLPIRSKYGKCNACRREQDLTRCATCEVNWHDKKYDKCFKCNQKGSDIK